MTSLEYEVIAAGYRRRAWDIVMRVRGHRCSEAGQCIVADMGCGPGQNAAALIREGVARAALLLDISPTMVRKAVEGVKEGIALGVCGDMACTPLRGDCVDAVIMVASLHHLTKKEDRLCALRESFRVLKAGGAVLVVVWARWQVRLLPLLLRGVTRYVLGRSESPWDVVKCSRGGAVCREYHLYSLGELITDVRGAGFKVVEAGTYVAPGRKSLPRKNYYVVGVKPEVNSKGLLFP